MTTVNDFFSANEITGALTPEQAAQVLDLPQEGETAPVADLAGAPAPAPAAAEVADKTTTTTEEPAPKPAEPEPAILAKDGKHLIPFEKLTEARESAQQAAAERDQALQRAAELQAQIDAAKQQPPKEAEPEKVDLPALRRERATALLDGDIDKVVQLEAQIDAEVLRLADERSIQRTKQASDAAAEKAAQAANNAAVTAMETVAQDARIKYPALDHNSPSADKEAIEFVVFKRDTLIAQGLPPDQALSQAVSKAADLYRWSNGQQGGVTKAPDALSAKAAADAAIAAAKAPTPATLSDIPGGKPAGVSFEASLATKSGPEQLEAIQAAGWSRQQIEDWLNRVV